MNVVGKLRDAWTSGPRPDVAPARAKYPLKQRISKTSARLSHAVFLGVIGLALLPRAEQITDRTILLKPSALSSPPRAASNASTSTRQALGAPSNRSSPVVEPPTVDIPVILAVKRERPSIENGARTAPKATSPKDLPLTAARIVELPAPKRIKASPPPLKTLQSVTVRQRDSIQTLPPSGSTLKVIERELPLVAEAAPLKSIVEAAQSPPAIGVIKKSTAYTVVNEWSDEQIAEARAACSKLLTSADIVATEAPPVKEGSCGAPAPITVSQLGAPKVKIQPAAMLTCPMAAALNKWMTDKVQPAALAAFGVPVTRLISASSYSCRNRYGRTDTQLSEHALINALDLSGFVLADGRNVRVLQDWGPVARDAVKPIAETKAVVTVAIETSKAPLKAGLSLLGGKTLAKPASVKAEKPTIGPPTKEPAPAVSDTDQKSKTAEKDFDTRRNEFLRRVHRDACDVFGTVLGPEANDAHRNHFHFDMKQRRHRAFCQ